jgi:hypothetical protein
MRPRFKTSLACGLLLLASSIGLAGCAAHNTVTNLPTGVTQTQVNNWTTAVNAVQQLSNVVHAATNATITLRQQNVFNDTPAYTAALNAEGKAAEAIATAAQFLNGVPNNWGASTQQQVGSYITLALQALQSANATGILGVKDPTSGQLVSTLISNGITLAQTIINAVSGSGHFAVPGFELRPVEVLS